MGEVATNLQQIRTKAGVSQQAAADYLGISRQAYSHYELNESLYIHKTDYETLLKLAEFFGVSVLEILGAPEEKKAPVPEGERKVNEEDIKFALFGDAAIDDELYEEVKAFARFAKERKEKRSN